MAEGRETDVDDCGRGRPLGFGEAFDHVFVSTKSTGICWFIGVMSTSQELEENIFIKALKVLVQKQEMLQMRIVPLDDSKENPTEFLFKPMTDIEKIDFKSVQFKTKHDWPMFISEDHDSHKIDCTNGPLWRAILGKVEATDVSMDEDTNHEYILLLKAHHSIADGTSANDLIYRQFLPILSALSNGSDAESITGFVPLTKSVEQLFLPAKSQSNPVPWYYKLGIDFIRWKTRTFNQNETPALMFPDDPMPPETSPPKEPTCVPTTFDQNVTGNAIKAAKSHGVSVHSLLLTTGAMALSRTAKAARIELSSTFKQVWPIDMRKYLGYTTPQPLGDIHSTGMTTHKNVAECTNEQFWKLCKGIHSNVKSSSRKDKCTPFIGLAKYFLDVMEREEDILKVMTEMPFSSYLSLSNLGNTSAGPEPNMPDGPMKICLTEQFLSLSGMAGFLLVPILQFVITFKGRLTLNLLHDPRKTSRMFVHTYLQNFEDILKTYSSSQ